MNISFINNIVMVWINYVIIVSGLLEFQISKNGPNPFFSLNGLYLKLVLFAQPVFCLLFDILFLFWFLFFSFSFLRTFFMNSTHFFFSSNFIVFFSFYLFTWPDLSIVSFSKEEILRWKTLRRANPDLSWKKKFFEIKFVA